MYTRMSYVYTKSLRKVGNRLFFTERGIFKFNEMRNMFTDGR